MAWQPAARLVVNHSAHIIRPRALSPGTRLGAYDVLAKLGEGGMGKGLFARATRSSVRDVALKILPEAFAGDPDRLMRFDISSDGLDDAATASTTTSAAPDARSSDGA